MRDDVASFASDLVNTYNADDVLLAVTSNGRLRYFLTLIPDEFERRIAANTYSVKTGNIGKLIHENGEFNLQYWNLEPHVALARTARG